MRLDFILIDIATLILAILITFQSFYIYKLVGGKGRIITSGAFLYLALIRVVSLGVDTYFPDIPSRQLSLGFYVLMAIGLGMLVSELRSVMKVRKSQSFWQKLRDGILSAWRDK